MNGDTHELVVEQAATPTPLEVQLDSQKAIARISAIAQVIDGCLKIALQRTTATDWRCASDQLVLQHSGIMKCRVLFGIYFRGRETTREPRDGNTYAVVVTGTVGSKLLDSLYGEVTLDAEGERLSTDAFFGKRVPDYRDVRKAALLNFECRAVTALLGLSRVTTHDLSACGVEVNQIESVR